MAETESETASEVKAGAHPRIEIQDLMCDQRDEFQEFDKELMICPRLLAFQGSPFCRGSRCAAYRLTSGVLVDGKLVWFDRFYEMVEALDKGGKRLGYCGLAGTPWAVG